MLFVTGDTHAGIDISKLKSKNFPACKTLTKADYVIITGDFGFIWDNQNEDSYWLKWFQEKKFTTLFVDGNHENFDLLNSYPIDEWNGGKVHRINDSVLHLMRGQGFKVEGVKLFTFGGAKSKGIELRKEHVSWWKEEMPSAEEYKEGLINLEKHNWNVDYIITHTCTSSALNKVRSLCGKGKVNEINKYFYVVEERVSEYSGAAKPQFRRFGNRLSGTGNRAKLNLLA